MHLRLLNVGIGIERTVKSAPTVAKVNHMLSPSGSTSQCCPAVRSIKERINGE